MLDRLFHNLRYSIRTLLRTPLFTLTVIFTLALGIGANTAVFSVVDAVLLRSLPFPDAGRLVTLSESRQSRPISNVAPVRIEEWSDSSSTFEAITGYYTEDVSVIVGDLPEKFRMARVAPRFLDVWGIEPVTGRGFTDEEYEEGAAPVVLVSSSYWKLHLNSDPDVVDRTINIGDEIYTIIGVLPDPYRYPDPSISFWKPRIYFDFVLGRNNLWYSGFGRLKPGVTLAQAQADLDVVQSRLAEQFPETDRNVGVWMEPLKDTVTGTVNNSMWLLFGAVSVLLLIACINIAALLLSRVTQRGHDVAIRYSVGATRSAIIMQMLTEAAVLAIAGALFGLLVAIGGVEVFKFLAPDLPLLEEASVNGRILIYTMSATVVVALLCGLLPAVHGARKSDSLSRSGRSQVSGRHSVQWLLVGMQVALSVTLLAGAGLLVRSIQELTRVDPGFQPDNVLSFRISGSYNDFGDLADRISDILDELGAMPGVESVAISGPVPGVVDDGSGFQYMGVEYELADGRTDQDNPFLSNSRSVSPGYFHTMQIPLVAGELCRADVEDKPQIMVNRVFVDRYLGGRSAIGQELIRGNTTVRIAGVVGDAREYALDREPVPTSYNCRVRYANPALSFVLRTRGNPLAMVTSIRTRIKELQPLRAMHDIATLEQRMGDEFAENRLRTWLLAFFAVTALSLACLGVYGTLNYVINLRRREVGLRMAVGALRKQIISQFMAKALRVVAVAAIAGLVLAFIFTRVLSGMLYGVSPTDPLTLISVFFIVSLVAALASLLPAVRASRLDPMQVLREE